MNAAEITALTNAEVAERIAVDVEGMIRGDNHGPDMENDDGRRVIDGDQFHEEFDVEAMP